MAQTPEVLMPVLLYDTQLAAPVLERTTSNGVDGFTRAASKDETVVLNVCSEFTSHSAPVQAFGLNSQSRLELINDLEGQPMLFGIGEDHRLRLLAHVDGAPLAWQLTDITPKDSSPLVITTFDVHRVDTKVVLAAAAEGNHGHSRLFHVEFDAPHLVYSKERPVRVQVDDLISGHWAEMPCGNRHISTLLYRYGGPENQQASQILVGTDNPFAHYLANPARPQDSWIDIPLPEDGSTVVQIEIADTNEGKGFFVFYQQGSEIHCSQELLSLDTSRLSSVLANKRLLGLSKLGKIKSIFASLDSGATPKTDLFIAGEKGIGVWDGTNILHCATTFLTDISFKQVIASEDCDPSCPDEYAIISVFAISEQDELYYIHGTRKYEDNTLDFPSSGLPIRSGVSKMACSYNSTSNVVETTYMTDTAGYTQEVFHLYKPAAQPGSEAAQEIVWNESKITVPGTAKDPVCYPAYMTRITCSTSNASHPRPLPNYSLRLSSKDVLQVVINDRARLLGPKPIEVTADASGIITIVLPVDDMLSCPVLIAMMRGIKYVSGAESDATSEHSIYPAQRVMRGLSGVKDAQSLTTATNTKGQAVFAHLPEDQAALSAKTLSNFPTMFANLDEQGSALMKQAPKPQEATFAAGWQLRQDGTIEDLKDEGWLTAAHKVIDFVEDAIEWIRNKVKSLVKMGIRIVGKAISFVMDIAGEFVVFVIKTTGHLLRVFSKFLKDHLGINLDGFLNWLGFIFDTDNIKKTQRVLKDFFGGVQRTITDFIDVNEHVMKDVFKSARKDLEAGFKRPSKPSESATQAPKILEKLNWIMRNPILSTLRKLSPTSWLLQILKESVEEEMSELITAPSFQDISSIFTETLPTLVEKEVNIVWNLIKDLFDDIKEISLDTTKFLEKSQDFIADIVLAIFDSATNILEAVYEIFKKIVAQLFEMTNGVWKIPFVSKVWTGLTDGQGFSFLNFGTFALAFVMNLVFDVMNPGKLPFDVLPDPSKIFEGLKKEDMDLRVLIGGGNSTPSPAPINVMNAFSVSNASISMARVGAGPDGEETDEEFKEISSAYQFAESCSGLITGAGRGLMTIWNVFGGFEEEGSPAGGKDMSFSESWAAYKRQAGDPTQLFFFYPGAISALLCGAGAITQALIYDQYRKKSNLLRQQLDVDPAMKVGYWSTMAFSSAGAIVGGINMFAKNATADAVASTFCSVGDIVRQVCIFRLYEHHGMADEEPSIHLARLRLSGDCFSVVGNVASKFKDTDVGLVVWGIATAGAGGCTVGAAATDGVYWMLNH